MNAPEKSAAHLKKLHGTAADPDGGKACPLCGSGNPAPALFCRECGHNFQVPDLCPSCSAKLPPEADICESCGTWTGGRGCRFCGRALTDSASFCPSCGNPRDGIPCPDCGVLSSFDFCPSCLTWLTEAGKQELERVGGNPDGRPGVFEEAEDLKRLHAYLSRNTSGTESTKPGAPVPETAFRPSAPPRTFTGNQEARRYHMARRPSGSAGWLCAADGKLHPSPARCARAKCGGRWVPEANG